MYKPLPATATVPFAVWADARPSFAALDNDLLGNSGGRHECAAWSEIATQSLQSLLPGSTFLQAFAYSFGDLHHREALMIITLWLLALSPAGRVLSLDSYLVTRNSSHRRVPAEKKHFRWVAASSGAEPVRVWFTWMQHFANCSLAGADWVNGYTLQYYLYSDASRRGSDVWTMACATALSGMRSFMGNHTVGRDFLFGAYLSSPCLDIPSAWNWAPCRYGAGRSSVVPPVYGPLCRFYSPPVGLRRSLTGDKMRPSPWTSERQKCRRQSSAAEQPVI